MSGISFVGALTLIFWGEFYQGSLLEAFTEMTFLVELYLTLFALNKSENVNYSDIVFLFFLTLFALNKSENINYSDMVFLFFYYILASV